MSTKMHPSVEKLFALKAELDKIIVGYEDVKWRIIQCMISDGHILLQSYPGLGKTLMVEVLGKVVSGTSSQVFQMTPDMRPSDILGGEIYNPQKGEFEVRKGLVVDQNFVAADEMNRTPPKTNAALLSAMQERWVKIGQELFVLPDPFLVMATMNPVEQEGTFPLSEALKDRFAMELRLGYVSKEDEVELLRRTFIHDRDAKNHAKAVIDKADIIEARSAVVEISTNTTDEIREYIVRLMRATRPVDPSFQEITDESGKTFENFVQVGCSPRAAIWMLRTAAAKAFIDGRMDIMPDDVKSVFRAVALHRMTLTQRGKYGNKFDLNGFLTKVMKTVKVVS